MYRELVLAVCRFYHQLLPNLFEGLDDATELLLPDDLLTEGSIAAGFRHSISDTDCDDVEILGWLYQFYIAEKKDEVMARKKAVPTEDIPAVTQLFTPHWIVRYLVENSLGRLWLLNRPDSKLREQMPYYIEGEAETDFLKINRPEEIKLLDPACGSGHMLTYAFDLLSLIYAEEGYAPSEIPALILRNNLYGLEICPRAAQLSELALVFKARESSRRFFQPDQLVRPQIIDLQDVRFGDDELNDYIQALDLGELFDQRLLKLLHQFEDAKTFGSLIQPCMDEGSIIFVRQAIEAKDLGGQLFLSETHGKVLRLLDQAEALTQRCHVVVANPPYMGQGVMNPELKAFVSERYPDSKSDLFAAFIESNNARLIPNGTNAMITMQSWMFLSSYQNLRKKLLSQTRILSMVHLGPRGFDSIGGAVVQTTAFIFEKRPANNYRGYFFRLVEGQNEFAKETAFVQSVESLSRSTNSMVYRASTSDFCKIPGSQIAYWLSKRTGTIFQSNEKLGSIFSVNPGIRTGRDEQFLRLWFEVSQNAIQFGLTDAAQMRDDLRWFPLHKGGPFRKWYGNSEHVVNLYDDAIDIKTKSPDYRLRDKSWYFKPFVTWSRISSSDVAFRVIDNGVLFSDAGPGIFANDRCHEVTGLLNSKLGNHFLEAINPTLNYQKQDIEGVPFIQKCKDTFVAELIGLAKRDWDNFETSWDFHDQPLLRPGLKGQALKASWRNWEAQSTAAIRRMQELETENNRLFIAAYGLEDELEPEVPEEQITLARADARTDVAAFLSYAVGCMMGRYSLDEPGLTLADSLDSQADHLAAYEGKAGKPLSEVQYLPDADGILPVLDGEWFEDDIVARSREFLAVTFPESSLAENLRFIETSLSKDLRKYFCSDFYKDHLQTYKKRPIYWMVQSPKKGFGCLIYLHRYTKDTLNLVLNNYFRPYLSKLEARLAQLGLDQLNDDLPTRERTAARKEAEKITKVLRECQAWEQDALLPLAQQRIELDLDDGVKVNYLKLQEVLAPIPGLAAKED
ncbi:BREX-1 system adenine-specific DNA-methyltransferase PglX [Cyanobium sp. ATX-6F1]|uniref:BREX-1 system adenine-specific DNA-methyltransferase PglX n=1 Tax=Cyanobium sp. ATX-6F1 TaxID=3137388 RepID=UPI0039BE4933